MQVLKNKLSKIIYGMTENEKQERKANRRIRNLLFLASIFIVVSFVAPWLFTKYSIVDLSDKGTIGDALGGIMNPFIALAGVVLTFLAFYIQYQANEYQKKQFTEQLKIEKDQFKLELEIQRDQFVKNQFENQFYEMLSIHRANINDLTAKGIKYNLKTLQLTNLDFTDISGVKSLPFLVSEFELCFKIANVHYPKENLKFRVNRAYHLFWQGIDEDSRNVDDFCSSALDIKNNFKKCVFLGKSNQLAHYYRQLFQTVKFIVRQEGYSYEEKRNFIRLLRSQLPNEEQVLLFYNWFADYGSEWENDRNRFFTDFRMIHNIFPDMLASSEFNLNEIFSDLSEMKYEAGRKDSLFEFQDKEYNVGNTS